jgi:hypothetical protein
MSSTIKSAYGANNQTITCTITSLTNTSQRQSTAIDNTTNLFLDALVQVKIKTNASSTSATGFVVVYAYGTADGGSDYGDTVTGSDGSVTLTIPPNLRVVGIINAVANSTTYVLNPVSIASVFGGKLPDHWGIVVENQTGATLDASVGSSWYQGIQAQIV